MAETRTFADGDGYRVETWAEVGRPTQIGRYLVLDEIGRGGMGVVWTAYDPKLDRKVAIKLLKLQPEPGSARAKVRQARFVREAQALAKLNHPNIVTVHDVDTQDGRLYMAMEYIEGQTLEQWLEQPRTWQEVLAIFDEAGRGLVAAHEAGITHRDFKPSNLIIARNGRVKVLDFGLAKEVARVERVQAEGVRSDEDSGAEAISVDGTTADPSAELVSASNRLTRSGDIMDVIGSSANLKLTQFGRVVGTPAYMAPEQYMAESENAVGVWTDQFSFAVSLYEALYGVLPFRGKTLFESYESIESGRVQEPRRDTQVPGWILRVLRRALQLRPEERYPSMERLLAALRDDPAKKRQRIASWAAGAGLLVLALYGVAEAVAPDEVTPCRGATERLAGVWDAGQRETVAQGLLATELPYAVDTAKRVATRLDDYAEDWAAQHTAICEATRIQGTQSEALLDVRMHCLERRRDELGALTKVLARADRDTVEHAMAAVSELRDPVACASAQPGVESALPEDAAERERFVALQVRIDEANAANTAGRYAEVETVASAVAKEAMAAGHPSLAARAWQLEGAALRNLGRLDEAQSRLRDAIAAAAEVGDVRVELGGWIELLYMAGVVRDDLQQADDWRFAAQVAFTRPDAPRELEFGLRLVEGGMMLKRHLFEEAMRLGEQARQLALSQYGHDSLQHANALNNLGIVAAEQADWGLAETRLRESFDLKRELLGPEHPEVARNAMNLANALVAHAEQTKAEEVYVEAEQLYRQAISFWERNYGPSSARVARTLVMLGRLQRIRGELAQARETYARTLSILRELPDVEGELSVALTNLGRLAQEEKDYAQAETHYREALAIQRGKYGDDHVLVGRTWVLLCQVLVEDARYETAWPECAMAVERTRAGADGPGSSMFSMVRELAIEAAEQVGETERAAALRAEAAEESGSEDGSDAEAPSDAEGDVEPPGPSSAGKTPGSSVAPTAPPAGP